MKRYEPKFPYNMEEDDNGRYIKILDIEITRAKMRITLCDVLAHFECSHLVYPNEYGENSEKKLIEKIERVLKETIL